MSRLHPLPLCCLSGGMALLLCALARTAGLSQASSRPFVMAVLVFLFLLCAALLFLCCRRWETVCLALLPVGLALLLRTLLLDHITDDYVTFLSDWAAFFRENGGWAAVALPKGNYTAPYLYFLAAISYLPFYDLYLIKLFSILFDVILAWGGCRLVQALVPGDRYRGAAAFCLLLLLPTVILNASAWPSAMPFTLPCVSMDWPQGWRGGQGPPPFWPGWPSPASSRPSFSCPCGRYCGCPVGLDSGTCCGFQPPAFSPFSPPWPWENLWRTRWGSTSARLPSTAPTSRSTPPPSTP